MSTTTQQFRNIFAAFGRPEHARRVQMLLDNCPDAETKKNLLYALYVEGIPIPTKKK